MNRSCRPGGLTIAELVLAMAITGVVGLSVSGVFMALSTAQAHSEDHQTYVQTARCTARHVQRILRKAKLIVAADAEGLLVWSEDTNGDGLINISELVGFVYDEQGKVLEQKRVAFPASMSPATRDALDVHMALADLSDLADLDAKAQSTVPQYYVEELLADNVREFTGELDAAAPLTKTVKLRLKIGTEKRVVTVYACATLRADETTRVGTSGGVYVLTTPE